jgi:hypothetical protein
MTESEWMASSDPEPFLAAVRNVGSKRKLLLFATATFSRLMHLLPHAQQLQAVELLEQMGEGTASPHAWRQARSDALIDWRGSAYTGDHGIDDPAQVALMLYRAIVSTDAAGHAVTATNGIMNSTDLRTEQSRLLRDIFGNPFRPVAFDPRWRTADVTDLARAIYADRVFDRMPVLADALMDAGCEDEQVIGHCRGPGPHVRGCWVVDLVLGKE